MQRLPFPQLAVMCLAVAVRAAIVSQAAVGQQTVNNFSYQAQDWWANNWPLCSTGQLQSPIEIESAGEFQSIELHLSFENADRPLMIQPNGSMRIEYGYGMLTARYPGEEESIYQSTSISFKTPGEHSVDGQRGALEMEVRFRKIQGNGSPLAILAVRIASTINATTDLWEDQLKAGNGRFFQSKKVNFGQLMKIVKAKRLFVYRGSLTRPPCSEMVLWIVTEAILTVRPSSLAIMSSLINQGRPNNRVLQPTKSQVIYAAGDLE